MRRPRVWFWVFSGFCLFALGLGWLARPDDELAGLRALHPKEEKLMTFLDGDVILVPRRTFTFWVDPERVVSVFLSLGSSSTAGREAFRKTTLPSGTLLVLGTIKQSGKQDPTCWLMVFDSPESNWTERIWKNLKVRLWI